jgi:hypothetical protein
MQKKALGSDKEKRIADIEKRRAMAQVGSETVDEKKEVNKPVPEIKDQKI